MFEGEKDRAMIHRSEGAAVNGVGVHAMSRRG